MQAREASTDFVCFVIVAAGQDRDVEMVGVVGTIFQEEEEVFRLWAYLFLAEEEVRLLI